MDYRYHDPEINNNNRYPNDYEKGDTSLNLENRIERSYIPNEPVKKTKKSGGFIKKTFAAMALGIIFGLCAGVSMYFVNMVSKDDKVEDTISKQIEQTETESVAQQTMYTVPDSEIDRTDTGTITAVVTDVTDVVDEVMPSVVSITNIYTETQSFWGQSFSSESKASGSGILIGENENELLIVTNQHVVADADSLKVQFIDGEVADAQVKGVDSNMDLAVISVKLEDLKEDTKDAISIATMGDSSKLKVGEPAIAIGNALGYGQSVTTGVISALDRQIEMEEDGSTTGKLIQTDAAINPGNSGGALLNIKGEVIGINSNKIGGSAIEGMGYAIPISSAEPIITELMTKETKEKVEEGKRGFLGIRGINVTSDITKMYGIPEGVYITQVYENSPAAAAGLIKGDVIVGFEGSSVGSMEDLQEYMEYYEAGEMVALKVMRVSGIDYEEITIVVTLGVLE